MSDNVTRACRDLNMLSKKGKVACEMFLKECEKQGVHIFVTETYRSQARQTWLYEQGRTRPGKIVTQIRKVGYHNSGNAWDIACKGPNLYDDKILAKAGAIAKSLGIEWGGYWTGFVDKPHFQISDSWEPPKQAKKDDELSEAVNKIINSGIKINAASWNKIESINLNNVQALLNKLGGLDKLIALQVIVEKEKWRTGQYKANDIRWLLIKYSKKIC